MILFQKCLKEETENDIAEDASKINKQAFKEEYLKEDKSNIFRI